MVTYTMICNYDPSKKDQNISKTFAFIFYHGIWLYEVAGHIFHNQSVGSN